MNPLYIGTAERRLFGLYEPAAPSRGRPRAAVLCYPWGSEYIYAHRSMRQLAARLSTAGYHTLRFDYFGTGDSSGDAAQTDLVGSDSDAEAAIEALKDIAGTPKVALIGLRVGANIAVHVASRHPAEIDALVLWDPIVSGEQYARSLQEPSAADSDNELGANMLRDLRAIDLRSDLEVLPERALMLVTERLPAHEQLRGISIEFLTAPCPWIESITTSGALPVPVIQRIEEWLR